MVKDAVTVPAVTAGPRMKTAVTCTITIWMQATVVGGIEKDPFRSVRTFMPPTYTGEHDPPSLVDTPGSRQGQILGNNMN